MLQYENPKQTMQRINTLYSFGFKLPEIAEALKLSVGDVLNIKAKQRRKQGNA